MTAAILRYVEGRPVGPELGGWAEVNTDPIMLGPDADTEWGANCIVAIADTYDGWAARRSGDAFALLLYPNDRIAWARLGAMQQNHCALFGAAVARHAGADDAWLWRPYEGHNDAVSAIKAMAQRAGQWRTPEGGGEPGRGCLVMIGAQLPGGAPDPRYVRGQRATEHISVLTRLGPGPEGADYVHGVDGGQVDEAGAPAIALRTRRIDRVGGELWWGHTAHGKDSAGRPLVGRRVVGWWDLPATARPRPALVPEAFARA